jgi:hypothetical protein
MSRCRVVIGGYFDQVALWDKVSSSFSKEIKSLKAWSCGKWVRNKPSAGNVPFMGAGVNEAEFVLSSGELHFFPSPLLAGWGNLSGIDEMSRPNEQAQRSFLSIQNSLEYKGIARYPAVFVYVGDDAPRVFSDIASTVALHSDGVIDFVWLLGDKSTALYNPMFWLAPKPTLYGTLDSAAIKGTVRAYLRRIDPLRVLEFGEFEEIVV